MRKIALIAIAAALATLAPALTADAKLTSIGAPQVTFHADGPVGLNIDGWSSDLTAKETDGQIVVSAPLTNLKTDNSLRDKHLRKYLEVDKQGYSAARLTVSLADLKLPDDQQTVTHHAKGKFWMHGKERSIDFDYRAKRTGSDFMVQGKTHIDIRDYGVEVPCYLGVCVKPEVKIKVTFKLRQS
jgi:polyisoprenoid-binding protein YceI